MTSLHTDGLRQWLAIDPWLKEPSSRRFPFICEYALPDGGRAYVTGKNCVSGCELVEHHWQHTADGLSFIGKLPAADHPSLCAPSGSVPENL